jgi:hypothetical protein
MATRSECQRALALYEEDLSRRRNVVGLGIVPCSPLIQLARHDELVVAVYVSRKVPAEQLNPEDMLPRVLRVRDRGETIEVPVQVIQQGPISLDAVR